jgi:hypothetical protein
VSRKTSVAILSILACTGIACAQSQQAPAPFAGFAARTAIPVLQRAHSVVADDMNEDGRIDLVVAVAGANSVALLPGKGDGSFGPPIYLPVGKTPKFAVTGDFNHDHHRDIAVADQDDDTISVLLGNGDGTFKPRVSYTACHGVHEVAVADFNRDGNDDVVAACHDKPYFASLFLGNGDGTFKPGVELAAGDEPTAVVVGDFNGDGIPDLAFADRAGDAVSILIGKGDGTFDKAVTYATAPSPHSIRTADLTGSGHLDIVTTNDRSNNLSILYGKGDGTFEPHVDLAANSLPKSVALADLNGDGRPDIIITNTTYPTCCTVEGSTISVFLNLGNRQFAPRQDYFVGGNPFSLLVRDLNGDGKADVVTANYNDQTDAQHLYLQVTHALGISGKPARLAGAAVFGFIGLVIALIARSRYRTGGFVAGLVLALILAGGFYKFSKPRLDGNSHITIMFGQ